LRARPQAAICLSRIYMSLQLYEGSVRWISSYLGPDPNPHQSMCAALDFPLMKIAIHSSRYHSGIEEFV
jgi:hypothetical protein